MLCAHNNAYLPPPSLYLLALPKPTSAQKGGHDRTTARVCRLGGGAVARHATSPLARPLLHDTQILVLVIRQRARRIDLQGPSNAEGSGGVS